MKDRSGPDGAGYTMVSPDKEIRCDGLITQWRYQAQDVKSIPCYCLEIRTGFIDAIQDSRYNRYTSWPYKSRSYFQRS